jgi:hypothetical protein
MTWTTLFIIPFIVQIAVIGWDEFYFHHKRGLPRWERIGHPLDTLSVVSCFAFVLLAPYSKLYLWIYIALGAFSCVLVTKDEFVHKEVCKASEQWLHALLFLNHPLVLISIGWMWMQGERYRPFMVLQLVAAAIFCIYQVVYWNWVWKEK